MRLIFQHKLRKHQIAGPRRRPPPADQAGGAQPELRARPGGCCFHTPHAQKCLTRLTQSRTMTTRASADHPRDHWLGLATASKDAASSPGKPDRAARRPQTRDQ
jgi:hypothetical protein